MSKAKLRSGIKSIVLTQLSGFELYERPSQYLWPNEVAITKTQSRIALFIVFTPHEQDSKRYTLDIGWSRLNRFPQLPARPCLEEPSEDRAEFANDEYFTRIGLLARGRDQWWHAGDDGSYEESLTAATDSLIGVAVPYFEELNGS